MSQLKAGENLKTDREESEARRLGDFNGRQLQDSVFGPLTHITVVTVTVTGSHKMDTYI